MQRRRKCSRSSIGTFPTTTFFGTFVPCSSTTTAATASRPRHLLPSVAHCRHSFLLTAMTLGGDPIFPTRWDFLIARVLYGPLLFRQVLHHRLQLCCVFVIRVLFSSKGSLHVRAQVSSWRYLAGVFFVSFRLQTPTLTCTF